MFSERSAVLSLIKSIACGMLLISVSLNSIAIEPDKIRRESIGVKVVAMNLNGAKHLFQGLGLDINFDSGWTAGVSMLKNINQNFSDNNKMDFHISAMAGYGGQVYGKVNYLIGAEVGYGVAKVTEYNEKGQKKEVDCDCDYRLLQGIAELNYTYSKKSAFALQYILIDVDSSLIKANGQGLAAAYRFKW